MVSPTKTGRILPDIERNDETRPILKQLEALLKQSKRSSLTPILQLPAREARRHIDLLGDFADLTRPEDHFAISQTVCHAAVEMLGALLALDALELWADLENPASDSFLHETRGRATYYLRQVESHHAAVWGLRRGTSPDLLKEKALRQWASKTTSEREKHGAKSRFAREFISKTRTRTNERTITNYLTLWEKEMHK